MLSYSFSDNKSIPLYEQLYQKIKNDIMSGELPADSSLPSKRSLAKNLSISVITVENSYNQLLAEGYIYSLPRKGFYVSDILRTSGIQDGSGVSRNPSNKATTLSPTQRQKPQWFADFTSNANETTSFPFSNWAKLNRKILSEEQELLMTNSPSNGLLELRAAIANYLHGFRGISVNPDNIIIGAGTETIISILIQLLGYDLIYACEDPGYEKVSLIFDANNVRNVRIPVDEQGVIIDELSNKSVDIIHSTPSHHFPTGITMPIKRRYELLNWAMNNDSTEAQSGLHNSKYIIEDDYDSEFRFTGLPIPSLFSIDNNERVIYMNTFTKSLASTIRISYMVLPDHLMDEYRKKLSFYSCPVSTFEQLTLARFISEGYYEKHINRMRTASRKKRDLLLRVIRNSSIATISEISEEQAGLHFILKLNMKMSDDSFIKKCRESGINITEISTHSFMFNYSSIPLNRIEEAVVRINRSIS